MSVLKKFGSAVSSAFFPKSPRGKVRQAAFLVVILLGLSYDMAHPKTWNDAANWTNGKLSAANAPAWLRMPQFWNVPYRLGLDLQGGTHLVYVADMKNLPEGERAEAMEGVRDVIETRVNKFGVAEPIVQVNKSGDEWRLIADLAGVSDVSEAIRQIGETPVLEFKEPGTNEPVRELTAEEKKDKDAFNAKSLADAKAILAEARKAGADFAAIAAAKSQDDATKDKGGDLGWITEEDLLFGTLASKADELNQAPGTVLREVVTTGTGNHVVKFMEKREKEKEVMASHILVSWQGASNSNATRTKEEAKALIDQIKAEVTPSNFGTVATAKSEDQGSATKGGDLGWFNHATMVKPFADAAFALEKNTISDVVESDFGYHLIYKTGERPVIEYNLQHVMTKVKSDADYLPVPDPWKNTQLSGKYLKRAVVQFDPNTNEPSVSLEFDDEGSKLFEEITSRNVGNPVGIFLDGVVITAPTVNEAISGGRAVISGTFSIKEAKDLVRRMNAGALPVPISLESQQTVGASLGQESLDSSLKAGLLGFAIVALFMLLYYRLPGIIAIIALAVYATVNLSLFKLIPVTLSLSGIAGFILSVGMAVDANVLIFERMKEELRAGRPLASAIDEGFKRAWNSIRDSNFTTLISCAILFYTSSSLIKGFAFTLALGVLVSMFTAITVSRTLLRLFAGWGFLKAEWLYLPGFSRAAKKDATNA